MNSKRPFFLIAILVTLLVGVQGKGPGEYSDLDEHEELDAAEAVGAAVTSVKPSLSPSSSTRGPDKGLGRSVDFEERDDSDSMREGYGSNNTTKPENAELIESKVRGIINEGTNDTEQANFEGNSRASSLDKDDSKLTISSTRAKLRKVSSTPRPEAEFEGHQRGVFSWLGGLVGLGNLGKYMDGIGNSLLGISNSPEPTTPPPTATPSPSGVAVEHDPTTTTPPTKPPPPRVYRIRMASDFHDFSRSSISPALPCTCHDLTEVIFHSERDPLMSRGSTVMKRDGHEYTIDYAVRSRPGQQRFITEVLGTLGNSMAAGAGAQIGSGLVSAILNLITPSSPVRGEPEVGKSVQLPLTVGNVDAGTIIFSLGDMKIDVGNKDDNKEEQRGPVTLTCTCQEPFMWPAQQQPPPQHLPLQQPSPPYMFQRPPIQGYGYWSPPVYMDSSSDKPNYWRPQQPSTYGSNFAPGQQTPDSFNGYYPPALSKRGRAANRGAAMKEKLDSKLLDVAVSQVQRLAPIELKPSKKEVQLFQEGIQIEHKLNAEKNMEQDDGTFKL